MKKCQNMLNFKHITSRFLAGLSISLVPSDLICLKSMNNCSGGGSVGGGMDQSSRSFCSGPRIYLLGPHSYLLGPRSFFIIAIGQSCKNYTRPVTT